MIWKKTVIYLLVVFMLLAFVGCSSRHPDVYYKGIQIQWLDEAYDTDAVTFDNDWLQKRCLAAAEGQDLTTIEGLADYLESILPTIQQYFACEEELTAIRHYDNGVWSLQFDYQPKNDYSRRLDCTRTMFHISESTGEIYNYYHCMRDSTEPWTWG